MTTLFGRSGVSQTLEPVQQGYRVCRASARLEFRALPDQLAKRHRQLMQRQTPAESRTGTHGRVGGRSLAKRQLGQQDSQRIDVRRLLDRLAVLLLGRHVMPRADYRAGRGPWERRMSRATAD